MIVFYRCVSSGDPLFLGRSPSPVFTARNGPNFPATDLYPDRISCLKSNTTSIATFISEIIFVSYGNVTAMRGNPTKFCQKHVMGRAVRRVLSLL
jgi:hypothetical protein